MKLIKMTKDGRDYLLSADNRDDMLALQDLRDDMKIGGKLEDNRLFVSSITFGTEKADIDGRILPIKFELIIKNKEDH